MEEEDNRLYETYEEKGKSTREEIEDNMREIKEEQKRVQRQERLDNRTRKLGKAGKVIRKVNQVGGRVAHGIGHGIKQAAKNSNLSLKNIPKNAGRAARGEGKRPTSPLVAWGGGSSKSKSSDLFSFDLPAHKSSSPLGLDFQEERKKKKKDIMHDIIGF